MKIQGNMQAIVKFLAVLLILLIGIHVGVMVIPVLAPYEFIMMFVAFLLLAASMLF